MIDRPGRDRLAELLHALRSGACTDQQYMLQARFKSKDRAIAEIVEGLEDMMMLRLPAGPKDRADSRSPIAQAAIDRAIVFLRTNREWPPPSAFDRWQTRFCRALLALFVAGVLAWVIGGTMQWKTISRVGGDVAMVAVGLCFIPLYILYFAGQMLAAIHVFRVRILRQDFTGASASDTWPFDSQADLDAARREQAGI